MHTRKLAFWYSGFMKTTLDLPDDLMRAVKVRAAQEDRKLKDLIADLLRLGLAADHGTPVDGRTRVQLPLVICNHEAVEGEELTPDRVAELLIEEEVQRATGR
jgi:plasmid stability protein